LKRLSALLLTVLFTLSFGFVNAETLDSKSGTELSKTWKINFNTSIDSSSLNNNIYVEDSNGNKLNQEITLNESGTVASLKAPEDNYTPNHTYTLHVEDSVKSSSGTNLKESVSMTFTTKGEVKRQDLKAHFIDVGQGDSILLEMPNGKTMLIDAGRKSAGEKVVSYLKQAGISSIDKVVATHPDADHIGGLIDVLETIEVKSVLTSGMNHTTDTYNEFHSLIEQKGIEKSVAVEGNTVDLDSNVSIKVLNSGKGESDNNEGSVSLKVTYGTIDYLLTGDAGTDSESDMVNDYDLESEIYKVGHHGSDTSSSLSLINETNPEVAIFSYGEDNRYDHPNDVVVERIENSDAKMYSTQESGSIVVSTNGTTYDVNASEFNPDIDDNNNSNDGNTDEENTNQSSTIDIVNVSLDEEIVTIKNNGDSTVDLSGWHLLSVEGSQSFYFPEGYTLGAGETMYVTAGRGAKDNPPTYINWTGSYIWNNDGDSAKLFDENEELQDSWQQ